MVSRPSVPPGTSVSDLLARGVELRNLGLSTPEIAEKLGMKPTSYRSARAIYVATESPDPEVAAVAKQALEEIDRTGSIQASYLRVRETLKAPSATDGRKLQRVNVGKMTEVIPRGLNALQALAIGFDRYTVDDLAHVDPETLHQWAETAREFRATLFQFVKRTEEAHGHHVN